MIEVAPRRTPAPDHLRPVAGGIVDWSLHQPATVDWWSPTSDVQPDGQFHLPPQPTPLLDRADERRTAADLLTGEGVRLLTLVGPGGVGKTHLAIALAEAISPTLADPVRFVDLSAVERVETARLLIRAALKDDAAVSPRLDGSDAEAGPEPRTLLVLDNCEHLLPDFAHEISDLLAADRHLVILATSREPLHLRWEHRLRIQPLGLPAPEDASSLEALLEAPAVALFVARARAVRPDFVLTPENGPTVAALCRHLDGLPLAIELAAARSDLLEPAAMLDRLERRLPLPSFGAEDAPARHRTLDAAIGWSYEHLQPAEQVLFRRLAVLPGTWTLEAAEAVADTAALGLDALTGLIALVDKGLLQTMPPGANPTGFAMLETIRSAALRELAASGEQDDTQARLTAWSGPAAEAQPSSRPAGPSSEPARGTRPANSPLSDRESAVLRLVAEGLPSKQIGRELGLAERTVKAHVTGAMNKLGAFSRAQALAIAVTRGYL